YDLAGIVAPAATQDHHRAFPFLIEFAPPVPVHIGGSRNSTKLEVLENPVSGFQPRQHLEALVIVADIFWRQGTEVAGERLWRSHQPTSDLAVLNLWRKTAAAVEGGRRVI